MTSSVSTKSGPAPSRPISRGSDFATGSRFTSCGATLKAPARRRRCSATPRAASSRAHRHEGRRADLRPHRRPARQRGEYPAGAHVVNPPGSGPHGRPVRKDASCSSSGSCPTLGLRRVALTVAPAQLGWHAALELRFAADGGATRLARRAHRGPLVVQRPFFPEGPRRLSRLRAAPAGRAGRRRRADDRRARRTPARTRW